MTKSRIALIALAIGCIAMLGAGTAAYFTVQDTAYNVITTGLLDMTLQEVTADGAPEGTPLDQLPPFEDAFGVMPGEEISKIVFVENTGTADFYTRVKLDTQVVGENGEAMDASVISLDMNETDWTLQDGWYYYNGIVAPGESTPVLFTTVTFAPEMDNPYQNATATIDVLAQSVQSKNNPDSALTASGWPAEDAE